MSRFKHNVDNLLWFLREKICLCKILQWQQILKAHCVATFPEAWPKNDKSSQLTWNSISCIGYINGNITLNFLRYWIMLFKYAPLGLVSKSKVKGAMAQKTSRTPASRTSLTKWVKKCGHTMHFQLNRSFRSIFAFTNKQLCIMDSF